jgi:hypothetical protein
LVAILNQIVLDDSKFGNDKVFADSMIDSGKVLDDSKFGNDKVFADSMIDSAWQSVGWRHVWHC